VAAVSFGGLIRGKKEMAIPYGVGAAWEGPLPDRKPVLYFLIFWRLCLLLFYKFAKTIMSFEYSLNLLKTC
jgi:hypothetical protein